MGELTFLNYLIDTLCEIRLELFLRHVAHRSLRHQLFLLLPPIPQKTVVVPSPHALPGRLKFTVQRPKFNEDSRGSRNVVVGGFRDVAVSGFRGACGYRGEVVIVVSPPSCSWSTPGLFFLVSPPYLLTVSGLGSGNQLRVSTQVRATVYGLGQRVERQFAHRAPLTFLILVLVHTPDIYWIS